MFDITTTNPSYTTLLLDEDHLDDFVALQQKTYDALAQDKKHHLKLRTKEDLLDHLGCRMPIIGAFDENGVLVGQCLVAYPKNEEGVKNLDGYPLDENKKVTTAIVQALAVAPNHSGHGISALLLETAQDIALCNGHVRLKAKIADDNIPSQKGFLKAGFTRAHDGIDPVKGYAVGYYTWSAYAAPSAQQHLKL